MVSSCSTLQAVKFLRHVFSTHRIPDRLVSDNGTAFTSEEFKTFIERNGIHHVTSAPYHPATNGLAERAVQTLQEAIKKLSAEMEARLSRFLFHYRTTPHSTTGVSPAELLLGRKPRTLALSNGNTCRHHIDHVRLRSDDDLQQLQGGRMVVQSEEGENLDPAVCTESGTVVTGNGVDSSLEEFVADMLIHSAPEETLATTARANPLNEAVQGVAATGNPLSEPEGQPATAEGVEVTDNDNDMLDIPELHGG